MRAKITWSDCSVKTGSSVSRELAMRQGSGLVMTEQIHRVMLKAGVMRLSWNSTWLNVRWNLLWWDFLEFLAEDVTRLDEGSTYLELELLLRRELSLALMGLVSGRDMMKRRGGSLSNVMRRVFTCLIEAITWCSFMSCRWSLYCWIVGGF